MQIVTRSASRLYEKLELLKQQIEQLRQEYTHLAPGSIEHIALD